MALLLLCDDEVISAKVCVEDIPANLKLRQPLKNFQVSACSASDDECLYPVKG